MTLSSAMPKTRRLLAIAALAVLPSCSTTLQDLEGIEAQHPDKIEFFQSVDGYPNIGRVCIDGVAFVTTTREYGDAINRIPEWDEWCAR